MELFGVFALCLLVFVTYLLLSMQLTGATKQLHRRLAAQEAALAGVATQLGVPRPDSLIAGQVREALAKGEKIRAIKIVREGTGAGLKEGQGARRADRGGLTTRPVALSRVIRTADTGRGRIGP